MTETFIASGPSINELTFESPYIQDIVFNEESLVVTEGVKYAEQVDVIPPSSGSSTWTLRLAADRKGSGEVADGFIEQLGGDSHTFSGKKTDPDSVPSKLNFYFSVDVTFKLGHRKVFQTLYFAQGHRRQGNNWWVGGPTVVRRVDLDRGFIFLLDPPTGRVLQVFDLLNADRNDAYGLSAWTPRVPPPSHQNDWMRSLPDNLFISEVNLPGTHDSAAISAVLFDPFANQNQSISTQLAKGVRLLDVRIIPTVVDGEFDFVTAHTKHRIFQSLDSLLDEVAGFLKDNPTELVVLIWKIEDWGTVEGSDRSSAMYALARMLRGYPVLASGEMPTVGGARGRIVVMTREKAYYEQDIGLGALVDWDNNPTLVSPPPRHREFGLLVQDRWEKLENPERETKLRLFFAAIEALRGRPATTALVNFASATELLGRVYISDLIIDHIGQDSSRSLRVGWALFDFGLRKFILSTAIIITIIDLIIASNFDYAGFPPEFHIKKSSVLDDPVSVGRPRQASAHMIVEQGEPAGPRG